MTGPSSSRSVPPRPPRLHLGPATAIVTFLLIMAVVAVPFVMSAQPRVGTGQPAASSPTPAESGATVHTDVQVCTPECPCDVPADSPVPLGSPRTLVAASVGQPITVSPWAPGHYGAPIYTVRSIKQAPVRESEADLGGDVWVLVDVQVRGTGCAVLAMPQDFEFLAANGRPYGPIGTNAVHELGFTQLEDGEATSGPR